MLRVISGKYQSLKLKQPPINITRSTTDKIRESVFNILQNDIPNSIILDGFAGSGAMSIEAISRGATKAIMIEKNKIAFSIINENLEKLKINNVIVINGNLINYLKNKKNIQFDLIFLDPPYKEYKILNESLALIENKKMLKKYGKIIIETSVLNNNFKLSKKMIISDERIYGNTKILFIKNIV